MSTQTGTASSYLDFWNKLLDFLQNDPDLVAAGENWTKVWEAPVGAPNLTDVVLSGPGLSGSDAVLIGMRLVADIPGDKFTLRFCGMTGVLSAATEFDAHINCTPVNPMIFLAAGPMAYWFSANGRRFMAVAKISTVYEAMYAGLFLPFSSPVNYSYPLFVGGSAVEGENALDWRATSDDHTMFHKANFDAGVFEPTSWVLSPEAAWLRCGCSTNDQTDVHLGPDYFGSDGIGMGPTFNGHYGYTEIKNRMVACYGGQFALTPILLTQTAPGSRTLGLLHGAYHVPGRGNSAESVISVGGVNHLTVQNVFRTAPGDYLAIALED